MKVTNWKDEKRAELFQAIVAELKKEGFYIIEKYNSKTYADVSDGNMVLHIYIDDYFGFNITKNYIPDHINGTNCQWRDRLNPENIEYCIEEVKNAMTKTLPSWANGARCFADLKAYLKYQGKWKNITAIYKGDELINIEDIYNQQ